LIAFNDAMLKPGGYTREDILKIGNVAKLYCDIKDRDAALAIARKQGFLDRHEVRFKSRDGGFYYALLSLRPIHINGNPCWQAMQEDITEQKLAQAAQTQRGKLLQLLSSVAEASNFAASIDEAMQAGVDLVCAYTGWPVGDAFEVVHNPREPLVSMKIWHLDEPERFTIFRNLTEQFRFPSGVGLPGRVLATGKPAWITDVTQDTNFPRNRIAARRVRVSCVDWIASRRGP
jgi:PAS domain S-box-containing protein